MLLDQNKKEKDQKLAEEESKKEPIKIEDDILNPMASIKAKAPEVKKPRAFVAGEDLFDFSDIKIITGTEGDKVPKAMEEKPKVIDTAAVKAKEVKAEKQKR